MEMDKALIDKIKKIKNIDSEESIKLELYSIFTCLVFSKEIFKNNKDIVDFLNSMNINFKPYVFKTRTLIISKTLRTINLSNKDSLEFYKKQLFLLLNVISSENESTDKILNEKKENKNNKSNNNYMKDLLERYGRNK